MPPAPYASFTPPSPVGALAALAAAALVGSAAIVAGAGTITYPPPPPNGPPPGDSPVAVEAPVVSPKRYVAIETNPLNLFIGRYGGTLEIGDGTHQALLLNAYYLHSVGGLPAPASPGPGANPKPQVTITGPGGEIGYRYYAGDRGLRGLFVGPSFLISRPTAEIDNGETATAWSFGGALDIGFQGLVDRVPIAIGLGAQYTRTSHDFESGLPLPASVYTYGGLRPRFLLSIGYAL